MCIAIINKSKDEPEQYSQHKLTENIFFNALTAGGVVWKLSCVEMLHQLYEGVIKYALDYFSSKFTN